jgi:isopentenyl diphosphate isomerase/L-lactate dehydrogenase-like FMN-dependent dehydrogenase
MGTNEDEEYFTQTGDQPEVPVSIDRLREAAKRELDPPAYDFVAGGAGTESTVGANREAFQDWRLVHKVLRDVQTRDQSITCLDTTLQTPVMLAPIGAQTLYHPDGELATARAAREQGVTPIVGSSTAHTLEAIGDELGEAPAWFQLYLTSNDRIDADMVRRAEAAGYEAIVVTVDTPVVGNRERDLDNSFSAMYESDAIANYYASEPFVEAVGSDPEASRAAAFEYFSEIFSEADTTWDDVAALVEMASVPVLLKGIVDPADARTALEHDVDGIVVSNHGGRQLDGGIATLRALPAVVDAVDDEIPVLFDSGIRRGTDVVKAIALGATAVLVGRPYIYGLAVAGERGVAAVLDHLVTDIDKTMAMTGASTIADLDESVLVEAGAEIER